MTMTPNYGTIKKWPTDLYSHPPSMNAEKENTHKILENLKKAVKKEPTKMINKCLRRQVRQKATMIPPTFSSAKSTFYGIRAEKCRRDPKIPEDSQYQRKGEKLLPKKITQT